MKKAMLAPALALVAWLAACSEAADKPVPAQGHGAQAEAEASPAPASAPVAEAVEAPPVRRYYIVVDKGAMQVQLHHEDSGLVRAYRCALGRGLGQKRERGDCRTPEGSFTAGRVYDSAGWHYTSPEGVRSPLPGQYGPKFIRVVGAGYSSIGIHGTDSPRSLGRRVSHGCIRVANRDILDLAAYVEPGMRIIIKPGPRDIRADSGSAPDAPQPAQTTGADSCPADTATRAEADTATAADGIRTMEI